MNEGHRSEAHAYMASEWRLHAVVAGAAPATGAWGHLEAAAERCRIRVVLAPWLRSKEQPRVRVVPAWRFGDGSHVVLLPGGIYPASVEVLCALGVHPSLIRDTAAALRVVLRATDIPRMETLARAYLDAHGRLPALDHDTLLAALRARSRVIRLAAIASLTNSS